MGQQQRTMGGTHATRCPEEQTDGCGPSPEKRARRLPGGVTILAPATTTIDLYPVLLDVLQNTPHFNKDETLCKQGRFMRPHLIEFLTALGRADHAALVRRGEPWSMDGVDLQTRDDHAMTQFAAMTIPNGTLKRLAAAARVLYTKDRGLEPTSESLFPTDANCDVPDKWKHFRTYNLGQYMAVVGPVLVAFDAGAAEPHVLEPRTDADIEIQCVSLPAIDFSFGAPVYDGFYLKRDLLFRKLVESRMREIVHLFLSAFRDVGVECPVLCAIGCGAFKGGRPAVSQAWAEALASRLCETDYGFRMVFLSIPLAGENHDHFLEALQRHRTGVRPDGRVGRPTLHERLTVPVCISADHGMVSLAVQLARKGQKTGILVGPPIPPSAGWAGGRLRIPATSAPCAGVASACTGTTSHRPPWRRPGDQSPPPSSRGSWSAVGPVLAMQTTLLLHSRGINPDLYQKVDRWRSIEPLRDIKVPTIDKLEGMYKDRTELEAERNRRLSREIVD